MIRFERKHEPLATLPVFLRRLLKSLLVTLAIVTLSLGIGTLGYHFFGNVSWLDAMLNAAMILTGMGPVDRMESPAGKMFATFYALFSGIVFLTLVAVLAAPIYHRFLHHFHLEEETSASHRHASRPDGHR
jgi:hypothetical protein